MSTIEEQVADLKAQLDAMQSKTPSNKLSMIVFSGDLDKALAAFKNFIPCVIKSHARIAGPGHGHDQHRVGRGELFVEVSGRRVDRPEAALGHDRHVAELAGRPRFHEELDEQPLDRPRLVADPV